MTLIKSISGIRGTIGGIPGENLTPIDIVEFVCAFAEMVKKDYPKGKIVVGRDGRISGLKIQRLVNNSLMMSGLDVVDVGLSTTPTVEMEVMAQNASGGIIITASHNGMEYNALKFLNERGECINDEKGQLLLDLAATRKFDFAPFDKLGDITHVQDAIHKHIEKIIQLPLVDKNLVRQRKFKIVADCINSTGSLIIPVLCEALGCEYVLINREISGKFAHNPEPLEHNLTELSKAVVDHGGDIGIAVDPDVDRLALIDENGKYCGEEYTLVMVADYILSEFPGPTVSNLSSTKALRDITEKRGQKYYASRVGEVNVVTKIHETKAIIGGEGNGGIIYPELHSGRDALVGIALLLSALAKKGMTLSKYRSQFPDYVMIKDKIDLQDDLNVDLLLSQIAQHFTNMEVDIQDGVKIYIDNGWAHLRKSNTEPIVRLYVEGRNRDEAEDIISTMKELIRRLLSDL